jgi:hypothetical protein
MAIIEPKPHFRSLDENAVMKALEDNDPENPIAAEVARLIAGYSANLKAHAQQLGYMPSDVLRIKPRWPIEAIAMRLTAETVREALNAKGTHES